MQTDATTPNIDGPIMLGVVAYPFACNSKFDRHQTLHNIKYTPNNMQQGVQRDKITCTIQQCWELMAYNVASSCTVLNVKSQQIWVHSRVHSALLVPYIILWLNSILLMWKPFAKK